MTIHRIDDSVKGCTTDSLTLFLKIFKPKQKKLPFCCWVVNLLFVPYRILQLVKSLLGNRKGDQPLFRQSSAAYQWKEPNYWQLKPSGDLFNCFSFRFGQWLRERYLPPSEQSNPDTDHGIIRVKIKKRHQMRFKVAQQHQKRNIRSC